MDPKTKNTTSLAVLNGRVGIGDVIEELTVKRR